MICALNAFVDFGRFEGSAIKLNTLSAGKSINTLCTEKFSSIVCVSIIVLFSILAQSQGQCDMDTLFFNAIYNSIRSLV